MKKEYKRFITILRYIKNESEGLTIINYNLFTYPPNNWLKQGLKDFKLNYLSYYNLVNRISIKLTASSINKRREYINL